VRRNKSIRRQLQAADKPAMPIDDKRLASWNALVLQALVAVASFDKQYQVEASRLYEVMRKTFLDGDNLQRFTGNSMLAETTLEDYAYVSLAFYQYGQAFQDAQAIRLAERLATRAYARYFLRDRWYLSDRSLMPADPGLWIVQDTVSPSALTAWLSVVMTSPGIDPVIRKKGSEILLRVSRPMVETPYYYGSFILLRQQFEKAHASSG